MRFTKENNPMNDPEMRKKLSMMRLGCKNPMWKGKNLTYSGVHTWVRRHKSKPKLCEICNVNNARELHNLDKKYERDLIMWRWVCAKCHYKLDKNKQIGVKIGGMYAKKRRVIRYHEIDVKEYNSIKEAAEDNNVNPSNIKQAINTPRYKTAGYHWRYVDDEGYIVIDQEKIKRLWDKKLEDSKKKFKEAAKKAREQC